MTTYALFLGIDRYHDVKHIRALKHAQRDARELYGLFKNGLGVDHAWLLDADAGLTGVKARLATISDAVQAGDRFIFYFAGHGYWRPTRNDHYLLLPRAKRESIEAGHTDGEELLSLSNLRFQVSRWTDVDCLFILDACRAELDADIPRGAPDAVFRGEAVLSELFPRAPGVLRRSKEHGAMVLNACGDGQAAFEPDEGEGGLLRLALEAEIREALGSGHGVVIDQRTPGRLVERIRQRWGRESPQTPWLSPEDGRFELMRPRPATTPQGATTEETKPSGSIPGDERDERNWRLAVLRDTVEAYEQYVKDAPADSPHMEEAFRRIEAKLRPAGKAQGQAAEAQKKVGAGKTAASPTPPPTPNDEPSYEPLTVFQDRLMDGSLGPEMVVIPAGSFQMGSNDGESDEKPIHTVRIAKPFALGRTTVTQAQWRLVMGDSDNPSHFWGCEACPVENVSWDDAQEFIRKLNALTGKIYRLPSEAEWEYAAKAGGNFKYSGGDEIDAVAWHLTTSGAKTHPVAQKKPNAWGLYDMSGNVWECVEDVWRDNYQGAPTDGSAWVTGEDGQRVLRGGSWITRSAYARVATRSRLDTTFRFDFSGFRLARMLP